MLDRLFRALLGDDADRRLATATPASASAGRPVAG
jgi:hypothetical protein